MGDPVKSRVQAVLDGTGYVGTASVPSYAGGFYTPWLGQPYGHANGEFILELRPVEGLTIVADVGAGPNYVATQSFGMQHGYPFDLVQAYVEYCRGLFCIDAGTRVETFGVETIRPDQRDFTLVSPNFIFSPYKRTGAALGITTDEVTWRVGASPGPDRFWNGDNNTFPWFFTYLNVTRGGVTFFTNMQMGPDQERDTRHWRINTDMGLTLNPSNVLQLGAYGLFMTEQNATTGAWQHAGGGNLYARVRPSGTPLGIVFRAGYTHDDGVRTGSRNDLFQFTGGLNIYATSWLQFRAQGDVLASVNGTSPFDGQPAVLRGTLQMIMNPFHEF